jgi:hypothetical protein
MRSRKHIVKARWGGQSRSDQAHVSKRWWAVASRAYRQGRFVSSSSAKGRKNIILGTLKKGERSAAASSDPLYAPRTTFASARARVARAVFGETGNLQPRTSTDTCISYVSRMYPACIPRARYMYPLICIPKCILDSFWDICILLECNRAFKMHLRYIRIH